jgi:trimeric autotransporter adhesin
MNISFSKLFCAFALLVFTNLTSYAQDVIVPYSGTSKVQRCDGFVTDYSKNLGYSSGATGVLVLESGVQGNVLKLTFESFNLTSYSDYLDVYKGDGVNADSLIGLFSGTSKPADIYSSAFGKITLRFRSSSSQSGKGFKAKISCVSKVPDTDLVLKSFTTNASSVIAGSSIQTTYEVFNNSTLNLKNHDIGFFISKDTIYDTTDLFISKYTYNTLNFFSSYTLTNSLLIPSSINKSGKYYIIAYYNYSKLVQELDTTNNIKYFPLDITGSNIDLTLINPAVTNNTLVLGETYQVKTSLLNLGTTNSTASNVTVYLSTDNLLDSTDVELGKSSDYSVSASSLSALSFGITINSKTKVGDYNLLFIVDVKNQVTENNELNNMNIIPIKLEVPLIDLSIDTIKLSVSKIAVGNNLTVTTSFRNRGNVVNNYNLCAYYLSNDTIYDLNDKLLNTISVPSVNPFSIQDATTSIYIDQSILAGNYYLIAYYDYTNSIKEVNKNNNIRFTAFTIESSRVDLLIENPYLKSVNIAATGNLTVNYTVKNNGNINTSGFYNNYFLSNDSIWDKQDISIGSPSYSSVNFNSVVNTTSTLTIPAGLVNGVYYLIVKVDNNNNVFETNETNNSVALRFVVEDKNTDIKISNFSINKNEFVTPGNANTFFTLENKGNQSIYNANVGFYYSNDSVWDKSDVYITNYYDYELLSGDSHYLNKSINLPSLAVGKYYLIINADYNNSITESNEINNIQIIPFNVVKPIYDLAVSSLDRTLKSVTAGSSYLAKVSVSNFGNASFYGPKVGFYVSKDSLFSVDDQLATNSSYSVTIDEGSSYTAQTTITIPSNLTAGDYYLIYMSDYQNLYSESNEDNNFSIQKFIVIPSYIDLFVSNISLSKNMIPSGTSFNLGFKLNNKGNASVLNAKVGYFISTDSIFNKSAVYVSNGQVALLAQNGEYVFSSPLTVSSLFTPGKYYLIVHVDYEQTMSETNEDNNYISTPITITQAYIDLTIKKPVLSTASIVKGNTLLATCDLANEGNISCTSTNIGYYISADTILDVNDKLLYTYNGGNYSSNTSNTIASSVTIGSTINAGDYYLLFEVDNLNQMIESNEKNNSLFVKLKVVDPSIDLYISQAQSSSSQLVIGSNITVSCNLNSASNTVLNSAVVSFYISKDSIIDGNDLLLANQTSYTVKPMVATSVNYSFTVPNTLIPGKYYLLFIADKSNSTLEINENNNLAYTEVNVEASVVDLFMKSVSINPTSIVAGNSVNINFSIFNTGNSSSVDTELGIFLSNDSIFDNKDMFLKTDYIYSFQANSSYNSYDFIQIPSSTIPKDYFIIFVSDYLNKQKESNEKNNVFAKKVTVTAPQIDLIVSNFTSNTSTVLVGNSVNLSCYVNNQGTSSSNTAKLAYYLSSNTTYESSDILLNYKDLGYISSNSMLYDYTSAGIQPSVTPGEYYILAFVDYDNSQFETNELNNVSYVAITINKALPDLASTKPLTVSKANSGESITITSKAQNISNVSVSEVKMSFYLSTNSTLDNTDYLLGQELKGELIAGYDHNYQLSAIIPNQTPSGTYYILAVVDSDNVLDESNENNNSSSATIFITQSTNAKKKAELQVSNAIVSLDKIIQGGKIDLSCIITNFGDTTANASSVGYYLSKDDLFDNSDVLISYTNGAELNKLSSEVRSSKKVPIPTNTEIGNYYVLFVADDLNEVSELSEINNVISVPVMIEKTNSLEEESLLENINVYPNPTSSEFNLSIPTEYKGVSVELLSLKGEVLMTEYFENASLIAQHTFSLQHFDQGVYMLHVKTADKSVTTRIMKLNK